jgi:Zn finger protein HypA/HybF involved in hydrogenase expression
MKKFRITNTMKVPFYAIRNHKIDSNKSVEVSLTNIELLRLKHFKYLIIEEVVEENIEKEIDIIYDISDNDLKCEKCGKEYKNEHFYNKHIEKCNGGE